MICKHCGEREAVAKGLCRYCYNAKWKKYNPEKANATQKRYRDNHLEKCREIERKSRAKKNEKIFEEWLQKIRTEK